MPGLILALYGSIVMYELNTRAEIGHQFPSTGTAAMTDHVVLQVQVGRGAPALAEVNVEFLTKDRRSVAVPLTWIDLDAPIPRNEEQQFPAPGSRYATPLKIRYSPHNPTNAIAEIDAQRLVDNLHKISSVGGCIHRTSSRPTRGRRHHPPRSAPLAQEHFTPTDPPT